MKQIDVPFTPSDGAVHGSIPVLYAVENREEECIQIFRCKVGLPPDRMPSWMRPGHFDLVTHVRDGIQLVDYNASQHGIAGTRDADAFRYRVYAEIFFQEQRSKEAFFALC